MPADNPDKGSPSDHLVPLAVPIKDANEVISRDYKIKKFRPLPESRIIEFGKWITHEDWASIFSSSTTTEQVEALQNLLSSKIEEIFPTKTVRFSASDKPWITAELKKLARKRKKVYRKQGKSEKYVKLLSEFEQKFNKAMSDYMNKNISDIKNSNPSKAYALLKRLGARPGDCDKMNNFSLPSHANLSPLQSAERIADHFSQISQEYPPLNRDTLPDRVKAKISRSDENLPEISEYEVYEKIRGAKKPKAGVPGDVPRRLIQEFSPELTTPITKVFRNIIRTKEWPAQWKVEYVTPIQKKPQPQSEDDLRNISLTHFFSKVFEKFMIFWLMFFVGDKIDPKQYGGQQKTSITHYLIDLINFVLYNHDLKIPQFVLACLVDFSKAFNRQNHNLLITLLSDMGVPGWLLSLVMAFLEDRSMILRF